MPWRFQRVNHLVLLLAIVTGLAAGLLRARLNKSKLNIPNVRLVWLVLVAFLPQLFAFQMHATSLAIPAGLAAASLVSSQLLLLIFAWTNRKLPGGWLLASGLILNLSVILLNGGLMPISPQTVARLVPAAPAGTWHTGSRLGSSKDILLLEGETRLAWLSDRFVPPDWFPIQAAFSLGDFLIAAGVFWMLFSLGKGPEASGKQS